MIARATARNIPNAKFYTDWDELVHDVNLLSFPIEDVAINLSSVIHEVYSYGNADDIFQFWRAVSANNWGQIFVRDMLINVDDDVFTEMGI